MVAELVGPDTGGQASRQRTPTTKKRNPVLDGTRGLLAIGVLVTHTAYSAGLTAEGEREGAGIWGNLTAGLTVTLSPFFLLSGFLLYRSFARATLSGAPRPNLKHFFWHRFLRVMPGFWLVTAVALLLINLASIDSAWYVLRPLLLLHYFVDTDVWVPGLEITWSVVTEVMFYLLLPIMAALINMYARRVDDPARRLRRMVWPLSGVVVFAAGWIVYTHLPFMGQYPIENMWPPGFMGILAIGMMFGAASAYHDVTGEEPGFYRFVARAPMLFWVAAFGVYLLNAFKPILGGAGSSDYPPMDVALLDHVQFITFAVLLMAPLIAPSARSRVMTGLLSNRVAQFLGRISFGIYLWHFPMLYFAFGYGNLFGTEPLPMMALPGTPGWWELITVVLTGTIILATLSYYLVERPVARWGARVAKTTVPTAAT